MPSINGDVVGGYLLRKRASKQAGSASPCGGTEASTPEANNTSGADKPDVPKGGGVPERSLDGTSITRKIKAFATSAQTCTELEGPAEQPTMENSGGNQAELLNAGLSMEQSSLESSKLVGGEETHHARLQIQLKELQEALDAKSEEVGSMGKKNQAAVDILKAALQPGILAEGGHIGGGPTDEDEDILRLANNLAQTHVSLKKRLHDECVERRKLHNMVVDLKGAIRVFCRVRPDTSESAPRLAVNSSAADASVTIMSGRAGGVDRGGMLSSEQKASHFNFDTVFGPRSTQEDVFEETAPVVGSVLDGYNACIFAYGQTGSGKTWTMEGPQKDPGVNFRSLQELFRLSHAREAECRFEIYLSMVEVYLEQIRDLLGDKENATLEVKNGAHGNHLPGVSEVLVSGMDEAWGWLRRGQASRTSAGTSMNNHSSRSHCLVCLRVRGESKMTGNVWRAKLWLCDLAGSERVAKSSATGDRLKEAKFINKSLSALGDCINAMVKRAPHVPFRNSKLTYLLQDSLSGNSKTVMLVNVAPGMADAGESLCSLQFAARVRGVELGRAKAQVEEGSEIKALTVEIAKLRAKAMKEEASCKQMETLLRIREADANGMYLRLQEQRKAHIAELAGARRAAAATRLVDAQRRQAEAQFASCESSSSMVAAATVTVHQHRSRDGVSRQVLSTLRAGECERRLPPPERPPTKLEVNVIHTGRQVPLTRLLGPRVPASAMKIPTSAFKGSSSVFNQARLLESSRGVSSRAQSASYSSQPSKSQTLFSSVAPKTLRAAGLSASPQVSGPCREASAPRQRAMKENQVRVGPWPPPASSTLKEGCLKQQARRI